MTIDQYSEILAAVSISWDLPKLKSVQPAISKRTLTLENIEELRSVLVPWFERDGRPVCWFAGRQTPEFPPFHLRGPEPGDRALSLGEIADAADITRVHPWLKPMSFRDNPDQSGTYPVYDVGDGRLLLLDGNHRCLSLLKKGGPFTVELIVIHGPLTKEIAPDLAVFAPSSEQFLS